MSALLSKIDFAKSALADSLCRALNQCAANLQLATTYDRDVVFAMLEKPPEAHLGDFAFPCFRFAKDFRIKPADIALQLQQALITEKDGMVSKSQIVGAFLNLFVDKTRLAAFVLKYVADGSFFRQISDARQAQRQRVMIEYSQPNTHKEFHVGHVRNVALGDSLCRIYRYLGDEVIAANYPGDEGTHIAKCLWYIRSHKQTPPATDRGEWLGQMYAKAVQTLADLKDGEKSRADAEISEILRGIESKTGPVFEMWRDTRQWSLDLFYQIYDWLDVRFDQYFFESELSEESQRIVDEYYKKGVFVLSDGAIGCDLSAYDLGFMIVRKRDGNTLYATKDLVLARRKFDQFKVERSIYVVAAEQSLHFKQVFKTLELMGFAAAKNCYHLSYGHVRLPEGKMSSREGTAVTFRSMRENIESELDQALAKYQDEWTEVQMRDTKKLLCIGAIKYGMLGTDPVRDVVYRASDWVSFEGDSGPYLMYSFARTRSILRRAEEQGVKPGIGGAPFLVHESEQELVRYLYDFNTVVVAACEQYKPSLIAHHLYDMCRAFNRMYTQVSVLKAESNNHMQARVDLLAAFAAVLAKGLDLLGIIPPDKM